MDRAIAKARGIQQARNARSPSIDERGHGKHLRVTCRQDTDRQRMSRGALPTVPLPARVVLFRGTLAERSGHATSGEREDLSLTVAIEDRSPAHGRRFAFRATRDAAFPQPDREPLLVADGRPDSSAILDHVDARSSAPFLAGAIAQTRLGPVLHNPAYREAAGAYRRSDDLSVASLRLGLRSDQKV
jgi:hypothetical protein